MPKISLPEALRYLFSGYIAFFYLFVYDANLATSGLSTLGPLGLTASLLVISTLIYFIYRAFLYNLLVMRLHDLLRWKSDNYRTYLARSYSLSLAKAELLFRQVRDRHLADRYQPKEIEASGIHFLYMTAALAVPFGVLRIVKTGVWSASFFAISFIVFGVAAFLLDRRYEAGELTMLKSLLKDKSPAVDALAEELTGQD